MIKIKYIIVGVVFFVIAGLLGIMKGIDPIINFLLSGFIASISLFIQPYLQNKDNLRIKKQKNVVSEFKEYLAYLEKIEKDSFEVNAHRMRAGNPKYPQINVSAQTANDIREFYKTNIIELYRNQNIENEFYKNKIKHNLKEILEILKYEKINIPQNDKELFKWFKDIKEFINKKEIEFLKKEYK